MKNINNEFLNRIKNYLSDDAEYKKFLDSFSEPSANGLMINKYLIKNNLNLYNKIINDLNLKSVYENEYYSYNIYNKNKNAEQNISPGKNIYHHQGIYYIQEPSANTVLRNITFKDGDKILDLCASPGGKSIQALLNIQNKNNSFLISNEIDFARAKILHSNIERMGFSNTIITNTTSANLKNEFIEYFDKIIIDAPCSGEGMMRKSEIAIDQWSISLINNCAKIQKELLTDAYHMLKPGGFLVYSTCTYAKEEDEDIIDYITHKFNDLKIVKMNKIYHHMNIGEGQFYCILTKDGYSHIDISTSQNNIKNNISNNEYSIINQFFDNILSNKFTNKTNLIYKYKNKFYLINNNFPLNKLKNINVISIGIELGEIKKDRFEPAHHISHSFISDIFKNRIELDEADAIKYLKGEVLKTELDVDNGYGVVTYNDISLGLVKVTNKTLKNHYPKGLRLL